MENTPVLENKMSDREMMEKVLGVLAKDDDLLGAFAAVIEVPREQLESFVDFVDIPELSRKLP